jgi:hypothetical protein
MNPEDRVHAVQRGPDQRLKKKHSGATPMGAQYNKFGNPTQQLEKRLNRGRQGQRHRPAAALAAPSNQQPDAHQAQVRRLITNPDEGRFVDPDTKYLSPEDGEMWS